MEDDLQGLGVGGEDDEVGKATVQCLGGLVSALLQLYHLTKGISVRNTKAYITLPMCHQ